MTHNFSFRLAHAMGHYGLSADADGWLPSFEHAAPFLSIVVDALGPQEAAAWIDGARRAYARENEAKLARTYKLSFPHYLTLELGDFENTLARVAAWEALRSEGSVPSRQHPVGHQLVDARPAPHRGVAHVAR